MRKIILGDGERIICAYCQPASGPGWANRPLWYLVENRATGAIERRCLQPLEQTDTMRRIYSTCAAAHDLLMAELTGVIE